MNPVPKPWALLTTESEDGAMVLSEDCTDTVEALLALIEETTGDRCRRDNPSIQEAAKLCKIDTWHYCTRAFMEAEGIDDQGCTDNWYAPHGDGKRSIRVIWYPGSVWVLAAEATLRKGSS